MNLKYGDIYRHLQCTLAYENLSLAGDHVTLAQVEAAFENPHDDLIYDHFLGFDYLIYHLDDPLTVELISNQHFLMTKDRYRPAKADQPHQEGKLAALLKWYEQGEKKLPDLLAGHMAFMELQPFGKSSGMIGRMLLFKECLRFDVMPFIIRASEKAAYARGVCDHDLSLLLELARYEQARLRLSIQEPSAHLLHKVVNVRQSV